jgi:hypothetical protein
MGNSKNDGFNMLFYQKMCFVNGFFHVKLFHWSIHHGFWGPIVSPFGPPSRRTKRPLVEGKRLANKLRSGTSGRGRRGRGPNVGSLKAGRSMAMAMEFHVDFSKNIWQMRHFYDGKISFQGFTWNFISAHLWSFYAVSVSIPLGKSSALQWLL